MKYSLILLINSLIKWKKKTIVIILLVFFLIELNGLNHVDPGDEYIYYYMGKLVADGNLPYKDFFFAHPPLRLYLIAPIIKLFGFNIIILKLIPLTAVMMSAFLLFKLMKRFGHTHAILATILFLSSFRVLVEATYYIGINLTTMFVVLSYYYLTKKKMLSGVFAGLAGLIALYGLIPSIPIFIYLFFVNKKKFVSFLIGFSLTFVLVNLIFFILTGSSFITDIFTYHLLKPKFEGSSLIAKIIWNNSLIFISFLAFAILFLVKNFRESLKKNRIVQISIGAVVIYWVFLLSLNRIFNFYFIILFIFMSILGSFAFIYLFNLIKNKHIKNTLLIIIGILFIWNLGSDIIYLNTFDFTDIKLNELTDYIETDTIFGESTIVPLIALLTEKEIIFNLVDTNDMVFRSRILDYNSILEQLKKKDFTFIVRPIEGLGLFKSTAEFVNNCSLKRHYKDPLRGSFLIYRCK